MQNDSVKRTFLVATVLCVVCSVLVSGATVLLREKQQLNQKLDIQRNLLIAAGLISDPVAAAEIVSSKYKLVDAFIVDLASGDKVEGMSTESFNPISRAKSSDTGTSIARSLDLAGIKRRAKHGLVYIIKSSTGSIEQIVLPVYGKGLWSTLFGFLAITPDTKTIKALGFYQHGETPGLGGEVDNPRWKALWAGKIALNADFVPQIKIIKGNVTPDMPEADRKIDGLSGATITANGVQGLVNYWMGEHGYGVFLKKWRANDMRVGGVL